MSLDFRNTCPKINDCISDFKLRSEEFVAGLVESFLPYDMLNMYDPKYIEFIRSQAEEISDAANEYFEELRELNSEMRDVANKQISELEDELSEKEEYISELEKQIEDEKNKN